MNGLYPIIRRVRRPLVPVDAKPVVAPAKPAAEPTQGVQNGQRKESDGQTVASQARK
jgi:hypothetical protein